MKKDAQHNSQLTFSLFRKIAICFFCGLMPFCLYKFETEIAFFFGCGANGEANIHSKWQQSWPRLLWPATLLRLTFGLKWFYVCVWVCVMCYYNGDDTVFLLDKFLLIWIRNFFLESLCRLFCELSKYVKIVKH